MKKTHVEHLMVFMTPEDAKKVLHQQLNDLREQRLSIQQAAHYCRQISRFKPLDERVGFDKLAKEYQAILDGTFEKPLSSLLMEQAA